MIMELKVSIICRGFGGGFFRQCLSEFVVNMTGENFGDSRSSILYKRIRLLASVLTHVSQAILIRGRDLRCTTKVQIMVQCTEMRRVAIRVL